MLTMYKFRTFSFEIYVNFLKLFLYLLKVKKKTITAENKYQLKLILFGEKSFLIRGPIYNNVYFIKIAHLW